MTKHMEHTTTVAEVKSDEIPDWINAPIDEAVGFNRYDAIPESDVEALQARVRELSSRVRMFEQGLTAYKKIEEGQEAELNKLRDYYMGAAQQIQSVMEQLEKIKNHGKTRVDVIKERIDLYEKAIRQAKLAEESQREFEDLLERFKELASDQDFPWKDEAMKHQYSGALRMMMAKMMILADEMGLGKTLTSIMAIDQIREFTADGDGQFGTGGKRILYLVPASLDTNIQKEFKKWAHHRGIPVFLSRQPKASRRLFLETLKGLPEFVVIANYESWRKDKQFINDLIEVEFDTVVLDEAHHLKERGKIGFRGVTHLLWGRDFTKEDKDGVQWTDPLLNPKTDDPYLQPRYVFPMTGTPLLNKPQELFALLTMVDPENFAPTNYGQSEFLKTYAKKHPITKRWFIDPEQMQTLAERISNIYLRRTRKDAGIKLPPQDIVVREIEIDEERYPVQAAARRDMRKRALLMLADEVVGKASNLMAVRTRLRQIETWPAGIHLPRVDENGRIDGYDEFNVRESQKLDEILDENGDGFITEVAPSQRVVLFSQFKPVLHELRARAEKAGLRAVVLDGSTPRELAEQIKRDVDRYYVTEKAKAAGRDTPSSEDYEWDVVFANYKVGGTGLNMNHMTQLVILDEEWNPGKRDQAYDRLLRIGQTEKTTVTIFRMIRTVDMWMHRLITDKEENIEKFNEVQATQQALKNGEL